MLTANGLASLALGGYLGLVRDDFPLLLALALVPITFAALTACVLYPRALWVAAGAGAMINALLGAAMFVALSERLHPRAY